MFLGQIYVLKYDYLMMRIYGFIYNCGTRSVQGIEMPGEYS